MKQQWTTADLCDEHGDAVQACEVQFHSFAKRAAFCGPATTISAFEDNVLARQRLSMPGQGHILIVDGAGSMRCALVGDTLAGLAAQNDWAGIVVHGAVRDTTAVAGIDTGVLACGRSPRKCFTNGHGRENVDLAFGGLRISPGAWIYCDSDGMVVADREIA